MTALRVGKAVFGLGTWLGPYGEWLCGEPREFVVEVLAPPQLQKAQVREAPPSFVTWAVVLVQVPGEVEPRLVSVERFIRQV